MERQKRRWYYLLFAMLLAYTVKNIMVGADTDEGYGIMVGYRLAMGDRLLLEMWEPHQTSAIFTALFIKPFLWLTGGNTFLNIYLRLAYFLVQGAITWYFYKTFRFCLPHLEKRNALLMAMAYYVITPKSIYIPEYSNLHIWFFTLLCLQMMRYYCADSAQKGRIWNLVLAGAFLACDVLAYPSMALLFPVCLLFIWKKHVQGRAKECVAFAAPCLAGGALFVGYLFTYMTSELIGKVLPCIFGDGSHQTTYMDKLAVWGVGFGQIAAVLLIGGVVSALFLIVFRQFNRKAESSKKYAIDFYFVLFYLVQICYQIYCWFTSKYNASYPQVVFAAVILIGLICYYRDGRTEKTGFYLILIALFNYFAVILMSNWGPMNLNPYLFMGVVGGWLCWNGRGRKIMTAVCVVFVICNAVGYSYLMIGGDQPHSPIYEVRGYNRQGVRKGILTAYMNAYRYNTNQEYWAEAVPDGSTVLYVGPSQFFYMLGECTIAAPNTISTPVYDESMLTYWEINPDRYPDVVAVESWFGDIRVFEEDGYRYIEKWLEEDFQAARVVEYPYITVYYRY
ncbi:MAG: hypothetical protein NC417_14600 [Candidatus Gastranaerophilales bacterium]|nr:hypothetical protein [Candidatus Gastranaerophilales bacterium]